MQGRVDDLTGERFGRLTVIERDYKTQKRMHARGTYWICKCKCGNEKSIAAYRLKNGTTSSCGCLNKKKAIVNATMLTTNTSGFKGVSWDKNKKRWRSYLEFKGTTVLHKRFKNKQDAINARKEAEEKYFKPILEKYGKL